MNDFTNFNIDALQMLIIYYLITEDYIGMFKMQFFESKPQLIQIRETIQSIVLYLTTKTRCSTLNGY